ncbi:MAG: type II toxin-antitoxin system RelE/ParE family toxin [Planctomycetes bacterium]|nr:type II toxin-antitoxin system RelE/ParE family toxin [Planctomycetota bacterium]
MPDYKMPGFEMPSYELSPAANRDLLEIARYTIKTWGLKQADRYEAALKKHFEAIGKGEAHARPLLEHRPELFFCRCEHHNMFFLQRENMCPLILAIFHEKMDLMTRLRNRLEQTR